MAKWTQKEDEILLKNWGKKTEEIARIIGRTKNSIISRHKKLIGVNYNKPELSTSYASLAYCEGCRFPIKGTNLFCNAECTGSYCNTHRKVVYVRVDNKKNKNLQEIASKI